jgi:hypothetical protein
MPRNRLVRLVSVTAATAAALAGVLTGCASAAATAATTAGGVSKAAAPGGTVHLMVYSVNSDGPRFRAVLSGAIGDYGPGVTVYPDGRIDPGHTSDLQLNLARGSFRLSIAGIDRAFVKVSSHEPIYPRTCSDHMTVTGVAPVVAGSGAGAYRGIDGAFRLTLTVDEVEVTPCQHAAAFRWQVLLLAGPGSVKLG